jgi:hypothetical protein
MEAALTTVIVGIGTLAVLQLLAAGTVSNAESAELMTALHLGNDVREMSRGLKFQDPQTPTGWGAEAGESGPALWDDVDDMDNQTISPPIDARRQPLARYASWTQRIAVDTVLPGNVTQTTTKGTQPVHRVTVSVLKNDREICRMAWLRVLPPKG